MNDLYFITVVFCYGKKVEFLPKGVSYLIMASVQRMKIPEVNLGGQVTSYILCFELTSNIAVSAMNATCVLTSFPPIPPNRNHRLPLSY